MHNLWRGTRGCSRTLPAVLILQYGSPFGMPRTRLPRLLSIIFDRVIEIREETLEEIMGARCDEVAYNTLATLVNNKEYKSRTTLMASLHNYRISALTQVWMPATRGTSPLYSSPFPLRGVHERGTAERVRDACWGASP